MVTRPARYDRFAILLHWLTAVLLIAAFLLGDNSSKRVATGIGYGLHASLGLTVLALTLVRIGWRLGHRAPAYPETMARLQRLAASAVKGLFYVLLIAIPLTGWAAHEDKFGGGASANPALFGVVTLPDVPGLLGLNIGGDPHEVLVKAWIPLFAIHVAAALWHHYRVRDDVLTRMLPDRG